MRESSGGTGKVLNVNLRTVIQLIFLRFVYFIYAVSHKNVLNNYQNHVLVGTWSNEVFQTLLCKHKFVHPLRYLFWYYLVKCKISHDTEIR